MIIHKGRLYLGVGDGGGAGDKHGILGNAQNDASLLGKILCFDLSNPETATLCMEPGRSRDPWRPGVWAKGVRNPWKMAIHPRTLQGGPLELVVADVGQDLLEGIKVMKKGDDGGWAAMENGRIFNQSVFKQVYGFEPVFARCLVSLKDGWDEPAVDQSTLQKVENLGVSLPIIAHPRSESMAIMGGVFTDDGKRYIYGDFRGQVWVAYPGEKKERDPSHCVHTPMWRREELFHLPLGYMLHGFVRSHSGSIYAVSANPGGRSSHVIRIQ